VTPDPVNGFEPEPDPQDAALPSTGSLLASWLLLVVMALVVIVGLLMLAMRSAG
jgi:hypothetical protein